MPEDHQKTDSIASQIDGDHAIATARKGDAADQQRDTVAIHADATRADATQAATDAMPRSELLRRMSKAALKPEKILLLLVFIAAAFVCGRLGVWQLDRAYERANLAQQHALEEAENQQPAALADVLLPQATFGGSLVGKRVEVTGTYEPENQFLVNDRIINGQTGFLVLDSLLVTEDGSGGASWEGLSGNPRMPVLRGWIPANAVDVNGAITEEWARKVAVPEGSVDLVGWLQASESTLTVSLPQGQTNSVSSAALANEWGNPIYGGYLVPQESVPADSSEIVPLPRPSIEGSEGLNVQNVFYALQWWLFGGFAVILWLRLVRDDAKRAALEKPVNPFDILDAQD